MKSVIILAFLVAAAIAAPVDDSKTELLRLENDNIGTGPFFHAFAQSDGHEQQAKGDLKNVGSENEALSVTGSFKYIGDDGVTYEVTYVADENGFQPSGKHLPVAPVA